MTKFFSIGVLVSFFTTLYTSDIEILLENGWKMCPVEGNVVTFGQSCFPATVPGTVLTTLLENNYFGISSEEIYVDDNLGKIPDIYDVGREFYTFRFITNIYPSLQQLSTKERVFLSFRGINYRAAIDLCGISISNTSEDSGMFAVRQYEITHILSTHCHQANEAMLRVLVEPPDFLGKVDGGQGGDHEIARNGAIMQSTAGWDWIQGTPDRNTGIWDRVSLRGCGAVCISRPYLNTLSVDHAAHSASLQGEFLVHLPAAPPQSLLVGFLRMRPEEAEDQPFLVSRAGLDRAGSAEVTLPVLTLRGTQLRLWWPHSLGQPARYSCQLGVVALPSPSPACLEEVSAWLASPSADLTMSAAPCEGVLLDWLSLAAGVRTVQLQQHPATQGPALQINEQLLFVAGGNWIASDQLLRFSGGGERSRERYSAEVGLLRAAGLNMVRVWGGGIAERPEFFEACDRLGLLVYQEFWMTGDNNGRWAGSYEWPADPAAYLLNAQATVLLLRGHPSLVLWAAGNELHPAGLNPPPDILAGLQSLVARLHPQSVLMASSMAPQSPDLTLFDPLYALAPQDGPYGILLAWQWSSERNPGLAGYEQCPISFQPETGSVSTPVIRSLRRFLSPAALESFPGPQSVEVHPLWEFHKYLPYSSAVPGGGLLDHIYAYGAPASAEEYALRAQLVQHEQYLSLLEGFRLQQWRYYSAVLLWKAQSPWPTLRGALYDSFLEPTGGLFGARAALSQELFYLSELQLQGGGRAGPGQRFWQPLHVQLQPGSLQVSLLNSLPCAVAVREVLLRVQVAQVDGTLLFRDTHTLRPSNHSLGPGQVLLLPAPLPSCPSEVCLYRLELLGQAVWDRKELGRTGSGSWCGLAPTLLPAPVVLQRASYWVSPGPTPDYRPLGLLRDLRAQHLHLSVEGLTCTFPSRGLARLDLVLGLREGNSSSVAVGVTAVVEGARPGQRVSDGYLSLLEGEQAALWVEFRPLQEGTELRLLLEGWNTVPLSLPVTCH